MSEEHNGNVDLPESRAALERFVIDNDELVELESKIGRFNVFDALRVDRAEIRHSNFLAWLLDPSESHGQGTLFLRAILIDLFRSAPVENRPLSPIVLDGEDLRGVDVRREFSGLDLLVCCDQPQFVVAVENKIGGGEHGDQLERYEKVVDASFPENPAMFVFLTVDRAEASRERWVPYSYAEIHAVLCRVLSAHARSIGEDVSTFLEHYLHLLGSRFMENEEIDRLCQTIYRNHRQAIDLILERVGPGVGQVISQIEQLIREDERWEIVQRSGLGVRFMPVGWSDWLPPIGKESTIGSTKWLTFVFRVSKNGCSSFLSVRPTMDDKLRQRVIDRLTNDPNEFGLNTFFKDKSNMGTRFTNLGRRGVLNWKGEGDPDQEKLAKRVRRRLDELAANVAELPSVIQEVLDSEDP